MKIRKELKHLRIFKKGRAEKLMMEIQRLNVDKFRGDNFKGQSRDNLRSLRGRS